MLKDSFFIFKQEAIPGTFVSAGFYCDFKLTLKTAADFLERIGPYIQKPLRTGRIEALADGRTHFFFVLDLGIGQILYDQIKAEGRQLTEEEAAQPEVVELQGYHSAFQRGGHVPGLKSAIHDSINPI
ncbi:hypothetical protein ACFQ4C_20140 [Larkinella insperata]|uniref:Uncharacterized protein n=1 Tax=Larkinella insperata TaxID=332158 RepID=A0ABW3Q811_9BACT|nr:hypothetical protein [Larkinella insperata]